MKIHIISIFPGIFESFVNTSLIKKAQDKGLLSFSFHDPRNYTASRHHQVDDTVYG
jgi:tRNA (guanine37-N1)-methyltransferase